MIMLNSIYGKGPWSWKNINTSDFRQTSEAHVLQLSEGHCSVRWEYFEEEKYNLYTKMDATNQF